MGSGASAISIDLDGAQPFVAGQLVTGTIIFNNTFEKNLKLQRIYVKFVGEAIYTTTQYNGSGYYHVTHHEPFFQQLINLNQKQDDFALESNHYSWPISFALPTFLPPSLDRLSRHGPYVRYKIRVVFERAEKYKMNIHQEFPILVLACPTSCLHSSYLSTEVEKSNRNDLTVHAALADRNASFAPGDSFALNVELHNPNHNTIKSITIDLVQHRTIAMGNDCELVIPLPDVSYLQEYSDEHYRGTWQLTMPDDNRIIPSFYYISPEFSEKPIAVEYMLKLKVKTHGFFKDLVLNIPIVLHSMEIYMAPPHEEEEEAPPPSYDLAIATH